MAGGDRSSADGALIAALAGGYTVAAAAAQAKVSERTAYRRLAVPAFCTQIAAARAELVSQAVGRLAVASPPAVGTLIELLGRTNPPAIRLGAARAVLELGQRWRETQELEERIATLEAAAPPTPLRETRRWQGA